MLIAGKNDVREPVIVRLKLGVLRYLQYGLGTCFRMV